MRSRSHDHVIQKRHGTHLWSGDFSRSQNAEVTQEPRSRIIDLPLAGSARTQPGPANSARTRQAEAARHAQTAEGAPSAEAARRPQAARRLAAGPGHGAARRHQDPRAAASTEAAWRAELA